MTVVRWLVATVAETIPETAHTTTLRLDVPVWPGHRAGQHLDVRLTATDGYQAQRSYSIASPPGADRLELTVVRIDDGEVSPYLTTTADVGDQFELRGPIGGWFVWDGDDTTPVLLVGGGSGVAPLMAMMRHHARTGSTAAMQLVYSARTLDDVIYRDELRSLADSAHRAVTSPSPAKRHQRGPGIADAPTPTCSAKSAGHRRFDPGASSVDPRRPTPPRARPPTSVARPARHRHDRDRRTRHLRSMTDGVALSWANEATR